MVPALTMRLVAEENRTGSMEVLLTAPVNEGPVVVSKFLATWLFFLLTWLPSGLFLIALRIEVRQAFDYLPLLSYYVCLAAQGLAFVGMGLFFSTLTRNQVVAAVLTFVGMLVFLACYMIRDRADHAGASAVRCGPRSGGSLHPHVGGVARRPVAAPRRVPLRVARRVLVVPLDQGAGNAEVELMSGDGRPAHAGRPTSNRRLARPLAG